MFVNYGSKQIFKVEPEPGQSDGSGSSQIPRLRAAPARNTGLSLQHRGWGYLNFCYSTAVRLYTL